LLFQLVSDYVKAADSGIEALNLYRGPDTAECSDIRTRKLDAINQMFFLLFTLRTGNTLEIAGILFGISKATATRYFVTWLDLMARVLMLEMPFPNQEDTRATVPQEYKDVFGSDCVRIVLDCTNINIQTHTDPDNQRVTWSKYYAGNVAKILIGTSAAGGITFASLAYPGKISDNDITAESILKLNLLDEGDDVVVDKGFTIHHLLFEKLIGTWMPPKKDKDAVCFDQAQVQMTSKIANKRIHVERAMKRIKAFSYLKRTIPVSQFDLISHIVFVVAMLSNLQPPLKDSEPFAAAE
jgi:hypothetical protein